MSQAGGNSTSIRTAVDERIDTYRYRSSAMGNIEPSLTLWSAIKGNTFYLWYFRIFCYWETVYKLNLFAVWSDFLQRLIIDLNLEGGSARRVGPLAMTMWSWRSILHNHWNVLNGKLYLTPINFRTISNCNELSLRRFLFLRTLSPA